MMILLTVKVLRNVSLYKYFVARAATNERWRRLGWLYGAADGVSFRPPAAVLHQIYSHYSPQARFRRSDLSLANRSSFP